MSEYLIDPPGGIDSVLDSGIEPTFFELRMPDVSSYDPLTRLWQADELADSQQEDREPRIVKTPSCSYPWLSRHRKHCKKDITAIVDGHTKLICNECSEAWCMVAEVEEVQQISSEAA